MWVFFLIPIALVSGSGTTNGNCSLPVPVVCRPDDKPEGFPASVDELDETCNIFTKYIRCGIQVEEMCQLDPDSIAVSHGLLEIVNEVCDKDSPLYEDIVNNLDCAHEFFEPRLEHQCFQLLPRNEELERYLKSLLEQNAEYSDYGDDEAMQEICASRLNGLACLAVKLEEKCGEDAMETFGKIYHKVSVVTRECTIKTDDYLPTIISMYKAGLDQENEMD